MLKKAFELWLDESGDFYNDSNISKNPSLVGGVLIEKGAFPDKVLRNILNCDYVHSNEIDKNTFGDFAIQVLDGICKHNGKLVIFENKERLEVIDGSTTYLNVISEGIIQLLQLLSAKYGYIEVNILVAVRLDVEKQDYFPGKIINHEEYINRLQEKIIIGLARRTLSNNKYWSWSISMSSARKDLRLMLADVVCNSYLTRNSRKFDNKQKEELMNLYEETYCFTIFEKSTKAYINRLLGEGMIGEAIFEIYTIEESIDKKELIDMAVNRLFMLYDDGIRSQLLNIKNRIGSLIKIDKNFDKSKRILLNIQEEIIPRINNKGINLGVFPLDIYLFLLTVYTHEGNVELAERQINLCLLEIKKLAHRWESIDYYFMFKIRQAVHDINTFNFDLVISNMEEIEISLNETLSIIPLIDGIGELYSEIKSDLLGKALGTKLQARFYMIRNNPDQFKYAQKESNKAIQEFMHDSDIARQYQYRSQIECEGKNYLEAVNYLCKSMGVIYDGEHSLVTLLNVLITNQSAIRLYSLMHYTRIMAESVIGGDKNISNIMFKSWNTVKLSNNDIIINPSNDHPYEIILWKLGSYNAISGNISASLKYYNIAINICNYKQERLTLRAIGLGIMAEKASILGNAGKRYNKEFDVTVKDFINSYNQFMATDLPKSMVEYFSHWKCYINTMKNSSDNNEKSKILWEVSRKITY